MTAERPHTAGWLARAKTVIFTAELTLGAITLLVIFGAVLLQAGQRYLPFAGYSWTGEIARFSLIWLTLSLAGVLVATRGHIALELVDSLPRPAVVRAVRVFACAVVALVSFGFANEAWALIQSQGFIKSPSMQIPMSWVYVPVLIGFVSAGLRSTLEAIDIAWHGVPESPLGETMVVGPE